MSGKTLIAILLVALSAGGYVWHKKQAAKDEARLPGDRLLDLAEHRKFGAFEEARKRIDRLLAHLNMPAPVRAQYAGLHYRKVRFSGGSFSADEVRDTIILAGGPVTLRSAINSAIITPQIAHVKFLQGGVVVAGGEIRVEGDLGGAVGSVLVSKGPIIVSGPARGTSFYSPAGASLAAPGPFMSTLTAYNTEVRSPLPWLVKQNAAPAVFSGEPVRPVNAVAQIESPSAERAAAHEAHGARCDPNKFANAIEGTLEISVKQAAKCDVIDRVSVTCESAEKHLDGFLATRERWVFELCGQTLYATVSKQSQGMTDMRIENASSPPTDRPPEISGTVINLTPELRDDPNGRRR